MRTLLTSLALFLIGSACVAGSAGDRIAEAQLRWFSLTAGAVVLIAAVILLATALSGDRRATLRMDWFLPFLRKPKKNVAPRTESRIVRLARRVLPSQLFADPATGKPGAVRRFFKRIGPTMLSSPLRRAVQGLCLALFLVLFFYVCWPYTAQPAAPGRVAERYSFRELDQESGALLFDSQFEAEWLVPGRTIYLVRGSNTSEANQALGAFSVADAKDGILELVPVGELSAEQLDAVLLSRASWTVHEVEPNRWPSHYADDLRAKERVAAEIFLVIDPLVSISTAIAARSWIWSLACAGIILLVCVLIPRGFCGYLCPLGTLIDITDWAITGRTSRFRVSDEGWWVHIKYYLLAAVLLSAVMGVLVSGYVAAIPVVTRGLLFLGEPLQSATLRGWHLVPPVHWAHWISIALFLSVLGLGFLKPRFWCKYVCPSGAVFSLGNLFRATERKVESSCIHCNKCVEICPFDAIKPDFTTRVTDCTLCQTCGGVCPTHAIKFVERWNRVELKVLNDPPTGETSLGRRGFLSLAAGGAAALAGGATLAVATKAWGANLDDPDAYRPVRPPGSVPEQDFLQMCIRCGKCFKVCPNNVLQAEGFQQGLEGLWTPLVNADWAGCESSCNACGQVCPTGAIRALPLEEKKVVRMGLAVVNESTCLPFADREACQLCVDECNAAGYYAIEFMQVHTRVDAEGLPVPGTGYLAPVVLPERCVGCGLCQTRCYAINVKDKHLLRESAIIVEAGPGKEDRLMEGSYRDLRAAEARERAARQRQRAAATSDFFVPDAAEPDSAEPAADPAAAEQAADDPFGLDT